MSTYDRNAAHVYIHASGTFDGKPFPETLRDIADVVDATFEGLRLHVEDAGLEPIPGDDKTENLVHAMFRALADANFYDVDVLAAVLRQRERNDG